MLHWPDTMIEYLTGDAIFFSNDAFGQHIAGEHIFNDLVVQSELYEEAIKYYANILTPFSPMVTKKINEVVGFNLPVNAICPSHGVSGVTIPFRSRNNTCNGPTTIRKIRSLFCTIPCGTVPENLPNRSPKA